LTPDDHAEAVQQVYRATPGYWAMYNLAGSPAGQARQDLEAAVNTAGRHMLGIVRHAPREEGEAYGDTSHTDSPSHTSPDTASGAPSELPSDAAFDAASDATSAVELELVGIVDFRLYWPAPEMAYIGMIMVAEPFQREGIGAQAWSLLRPWLLETAKVKSARLGVEQFNVQALQFFQSLGFALTGETNRMEVGSKWVRLMYMEMALDKP
jgi:RimJ/RimL family protein N-acetyltransferase